MSQHITGNVGQDIRHNYGEFIQIGEMRLRKDLIVTYNLAHIPDDPEERAYGVRIVINGGATGVPIGTREEAIKEIERLDWVFKKELSKGE